MAPTPPGEVAEMDFERLGLLLNPETGRSQWIWGLSITLTYRRHSCLWPLVHQTVDATIEGLEKAWAFFHVPLWKDVTVPVGEPLICLSPGR